MHNDIINRNAKRCRESFKTFAKRLGTVVLDILFTYLIKVSGSNPWTDAATNLREGFPEEVASITYELYLFFGLEYYH